MITRREFVEMMAGATAALCGSDNVLAMGVKPREPVYDRLGAVLSLRKLGSTGKSVTMLGVGGHHIGGQFDEKNAQEVIEIALEGGVRFFDTAESYQTGGSESYYGKFLTPKYRDVIFLTSKTLAKDARQAREHLDGTLKRLGTEYLDLWQVHAIKNAQDVDDRVAGGVLDFLREAKEKGKVRHIGFTDHQSPKAALRMLELSKDVETCLLPINVVDPSYNSFVTQVLPKLVKRKMGICAMKTLSNGRFFQHGVVPERLSRDDALNYCWSLPISVLVCGFDSTKQLRENIASAKSFVRLNKSQREKLVEKVADLAGKTIEYYKA
jgi:uncharacterized protein